MFIYDKKLQYPVKIDHPDPKLAAIIITQYGGPYINKLQFSRPDAKSGRVFSVQFVVDHGSYTGIIRVVLRFPALICCLP